MSGHDHQLWHQDYCATCKQETAREDGACVPCWARTLVALIVSRPALKLALHRALRDRGMTIGGVRQQPDAMQKRRRELRVGNIGGSDEQ